MELKNKLEILTIVSQLSPTSLEDLLYKYNKVYETIHQRV